MKNLQRSLLNRLLLGLCFCMLASLPIYAQAAKGTASTKRSKPQPANSQVYYSCPMHPDVKARKAGKCPKCGMALRAEHTHEVAAEVAAQDIAATPGPAPAMNIPDVELLDQDGHKIHFYTDLIKDETVAINFIFTTCTTICPPLGATFARVQKELGDKAGREVRLISISVDPATDTPERLKAWGAKFHAGDGWTFVTGDKPQVDELLRALGASAASREDHSPTVLIGNDVRGVWTRTYGLASASKLVHIINEALSGQIATEDSN